MTKEQKIIQKQKELIDYFQIEFYDRFKDDLRYRKIKSELAAIELDQKPKRNKEPKIKICAACGGFAHGNPGHDIT